MLKTRVPTDEIMKLELAGSIARTEETKSALKF
jgi:hypothetical protein